MIGTAENAEVIGDGDVDGAIHRQTACRSCGNVGAIRARVGRCPPGGAVATTAGDLPADWVFHAVGPRYRDGNSGEAVALASCYQRCLALAEKHGARSLTLPAISTGVHGYPLEQAAAIAVNTTIAVLAAGRSRVCSVAFVLFGFRVFRVFAQATLEVMAKLG